MYAAPDRTRTSDTTTESHRPWAASPGRRLTSSPGEGKKAYFEVERDLWYAFQQFLDGQVRREVDVMTRALEDAESRLEAADGEAAEHALERVRELKRVYRHGEQAIDLLTGQRLERLSELVGQLRGE